MIGWLDCCAGASGDMLLGALVDAGVPLAVLQEAVGALGVGVVLRAGQVRRAGLAGTRVHVDVPSGDTAGRTWADVRALLEQAPLAAGPRADALAVFTRLAEAEAAVHGEPVDLVHFHEVGGHDALADIVGVCAGFAFLGLDRLTASSVTLGSGRTRGAHGPLPVPVPAVLALLTGIPVQAGPAPFEACTPTGAALLAELVDSWGPLPLMAVERVGLGAGHRDPDELANVVRLVLGADGGTPPGGTVVLVDANVDDLDPRLWPGALQKLLEAGASDAWLTPILMKKGRPAQTLSVLCRRSVLPPVQEVIFRETSTLGVRLTATEQVTLQRLEHIVEIEGQRVRVKTGLLGGRVVNAQPEWEDIAAAAAALGRPAKQVLAQANAAAQRLWDHGA